MNVFTGLPDGKLSTEVVLFLLIVSADFYLQQSTKQHVNLEKQTINWKALFDLPLTDSHMAALVWAHCICKREIPAGRNPFALVTEMESEMKRTVIETLHFNWNGK